MKASNTANENFK